MARNETSYQYRTGDGPGDFLLDTVRDLDWQPTRRSLEKTITLSVADYATNEDARARMEKLAGDLGLELVGYTKIINGRWVQEVRSAPLEEAS